MASTIELGGAPVTRLIEKALAASKTPDAVRPPEKVPGKQLRDLKDHLIEKISSRRRIVLQAKMQLLQGDEEEEEEEEDVWPLNPGVRNSMEGV